MVREYGRREPRQETLLSSLTTGRSACLAFTLCLIPRYRMAGNIASNSETLAMGPRRIRLGSGL